MTAKPVRHHTTVEKKRRFGSKMWWLECTCGYHQGWHHKQDAQACETRHLDKVNTAS